MQLSFSKMHGLGNDFVLLDGVRRPLRISRPLVTYLADRHRGVGCDQVLLIEPARDPAADFRYRIFNADGGEVQQCGNGSRCVARYLRDEGLIAADQVTVETAGGLISMYLLGDGAVRVNMGIPRFAPHAIPLTAAQEASLYSLDIHGQQVKFAAVSMGNPHAVLQVGDVARAPVGELGPAIGQHARFPEGVNVGFMEVVNSARIRLRVFERGAGETQACGTGACAAVVAGRATAGLAREVGVELPGGNLVIQWEGRDHPVWMTGPATRVFDGHLFYDQETH